MQSKRRWLPRWQRVELVEKCLVQGMTRRQVAEWRRVSVSTVQYWVERYRYACPAERASGVWAEDRPCTPHRQPTRCSERVHDRVCAARRRTGWGPRLIASELEMAHATVCRCLRRRGLSRAPKAPREAVRRFEWPCPGDLLQMDVKRFARFSRPGHRVTGDRNLSGAEKRAEVGYEFAHSIIDDHTRLAVRPDESHRFKNHEVPRTEAKNRETPGIAGVVFAEVRGMFVGDWDRKRTAEVWQVG
jgi:transposase